MKLTLRTLYCGGLLAGLAGLAAAATMTLNGTISDSFCGASHAKMTAGKNMSDRDCALACLKAGAQYVFVSNGKVYKISNQKMADLQKGAGESVSVTGDVNGDTINITTLTMPAKK
jgi:hypothetical protein